MKSQSAFPRYAAMQMLDALGGRELFLLCGISNVQQQGSSGICFTLPDFLAQRQINRVSVSRVGGEFLIVFSRKSKVGGGGGGAGGAAGGGGRGAGGAGAGRGGAGGAAGGRRGE